MTRTLWTLSVLAIGFLLGIVVPNAVAPEEAECECICPELDYSIDTTTVEMVEAVEMVGPVEAIVVEFEPSDAEAVRKAFEALEAVERADRQILQAQDPE